MRNRTSGGVRSRNPFHPFVLGAGAAFALTACTCVVVYARKNAATTTGRPTATGDPWLALLDRHCGLVLSIALAVLLIAALADVVWEYLLGRAANPDGAADNDSSELDKGGNSR
ncbi:MAG: hypothetical protein JJ992_08290 [Planctomycetes bacterium]|nr:hypothetical protein [Planctomycetota bacterium]